MQKSVHFRVDPKLANVLGESYTSSEKALKELIDNAWDAEATEVNVTVPNILTDPFIIVQDNGSGMKTPKAKPQSLPRQRDIRRALIEADREMSSDEMRTPNRACPTSTFEIHPSNFAALPGQLFYSTQIRVSEFTSSSFHSCN